MTSMSKKTTLRLLHHYQRQVRLQKLKDSHHSLPARTLKSLSLDYHRPLNTHLRPDLPQSQSSEGEENNIVARYFLYIVSPYYNLLTLFFQLTIFSANDISSNIWNPQMRCYHIVGCGVTRLCSFSLDLGIFQYIVHNRF